MEFHYLYLLIIMFFSIIQSVFGMGILVFGTPTLLLLGYEFSSVLGLILPSSIFISFVQVYSAKNLSFINKEKINLLFCSISVVVVLSVTLIFGLKINIDVPIGVVLIFSALVRVIPKLRIMLNAIIVDGQRKFVMFMGAIHGFTNMGGALLTLYSASTQSEKLGIRATVSRYYLVFGVIQLITLAVIRPNALSIDGFMAAPMALFIYWGAGNLIFKQTSLSFYERLLTAFIAIYGIVVLIKNYI